MERKLHLLDSFSAQGSDGQTYKVLGYEHMTRDEQGVVDGQDHWESTGESEYRLSDGRSVETHVDGRMLIAGTNITLTAAARAAS